MSSKINNHFQENLDIVDETVGKRWPDRNYSGRLPPWVRRQLYSPGSVARVLPPTLWDAFALHYPYGLRGTSLALQRAASTRSHMLLPSEPL